MRTLPDYTQTRHLECTTEGCPTNGRRWRLHPTVHGMGLISWPHVVCAGCDIEPAILREEKREIHEQGQ